MARDEKMPRLVAELHSQFARLLSRWERSGEGACISAKLEHLSSVAFLTFVALAKKVTKDEAIKANLRGLGYEFQSTNQTP